MKIARYNENMLDACAEFWWSIYKDMLYAHRPDGYAIINTPHIGPECFSMFIKYGLNGHFGAEHWGGEVADDSVIIAYDSGKVEGILVSSIDRFKLTGNILSCYVQRNQRGREIADCLLSEALSLFRKMELHQAMAGPDVTKSLEVECSFHLALLDAGFAWENDWWSPYPPDDETNEYGVFLGGTLQGFRLLPEIQEKREQLCEEGIEIERFTADQFDNLYRLDTGERPTLRDDVTFVALVDGLVVGCLDEVRIYEDEFGRIVGGAVPYVIPTYRRQGIGKVLYHLGIEEVARQGAEYGWTATNLHNPARLVYRSIGYRYWYTCFSGMSMRLR